MKITIIGGSGFIGRFLVKKFLENNYQITGLDTSPAVPELMGKYNHIIGDFLVRDDVHKTCRDSELVISLAAKHHDFGITKDEYFKVNVGGTINLLECMAQQNIKKLIFYSSVAVYGTQTEPTTEESPLIPDTDYGKSKLAAEEEIKKWAEEDKQRSVIIIRPTVIFGPENYGNVYNLINKIYKKRFLFVGNGSNIKSVAYVENLIDATIFLMEHLKPGVQVFNYSDEPHMTTAEIVNIITEFMPHSIPKLKIPLWLAASTGSIFDVMAKITGYNLPITAKRMKKFNTPTYHRADKIRQLGFQQNISIKEGFKKMVEWYLKNNK